MNLSYISVYHPIRTITVLKKDQESFKQQSDSCSDLHMLYNVRNAIAICVQLNMYKPSDCSVELEDEHSWSYLNEIFQYAEVSEGLYKMMCLLCLLLLICWLHLILILIFSFFAKEHSLSHKVSSEEMTPDLKVFFAGQSWHVTCPIMVKELPAFS